MGNHTQKPQTKTTMVAVGAITKNRFVKFTGAQCNGIGQMAAGVSGEEDIDNGASFAMALDGTVLVEAGESLYEGLPVTTNGMGKAIKATKGRYINGIVMRAQPYAGQLVEIKMGNWMVSTVPTTTSSTTTSSMSTTSSTRSTGSTASTISTISTTSSTRSTQSTISSTCSTTSTTASTSTMSSTCSTTSSTASTSTMSTASTISTTSSTMSTISTTSSTMTLP